METGSLRKYIYLSIAAAIVTISLKLGAYFVTGSVGLLSDGLESCVNLVAATFALFMLHLAEKPPDARHQFGHTKAEYFSSAIEGGLIVLAAASIIWSAIPRIIDPKPLENVGTGLLIAVVASLINLAVSGVLIKNGRKHKSITLEADGKHLMTDVWTSAGVLAGIALVKITGWLVLDGVVAVMVAINIIVTGYQLMRRSAQGLLDTALPAEEEEMIIKTIGKYSGQYIGYKSLMTRQAGRRKFISVKLLMPGELSISQGHNLSEQIERDLLVLFPGSQTTVVTHFEPATGQGQRLAGNAEESEPEQTSMAENQG